jgi:hypothetical protein
MTKNTVATNAVADIGVQLFAYGGDNTIPAGWTLPTDLKLCSRWRSSLGKSWYLLDILVDPPAAEIDVIHFPDMIGDENLAAAKAFLAAYGYKCTDTDSGLYRRA